MRRERERERERETEEKCRDQASLKVLAGSARQKRHGQQRWLWRGYGVHVPVTAALVKTSWKSSRPTSCLPRMWMNRATCLVRGSVSSQQSARLLASIATHFGLKRATVEGSQPTGDDKGRQERCGGYLVLGAALLEPQHLPMIGAWCVGYPSADADAALVNPALCPQPTRR
eukprot:COSAG04_NODE_130_length_24323_cov_50.932835_20_plen_172_part_00